MNEVYPKKIGKDSFTRPEEKKLYPELEKEEMRIKRKKRTEDKRGRSRPKETPFEYRRPEDTFSGEKKKVQVDPTTTVIDSIRHSY